MSTELVVSLAALVMAAAGVTLLVVAVRRAHESERTEIRTKRRPF